MEEGEGERRSCSSTYRNQAIYIEETAWWSAQKCPAYTGASPVLYFRALASVSLSAIMCSAALVSLSPSGFFRHRTRRARGMDVLLLSEAVMPLPCWRSCEARVVSSESFSAAAASQSHYRFARHDSFAPC